MANITPTINMHDNFNPASVHFRAESVVSTLMLTSRAVFAKRYETTHNTIAIPSLMSVPLRPFPEEKKNGITNVHNTATTNNTIDQLSDAVIIPSE